MLESFLFKVKDHRRKQGRRYELGHILFFTILAILSGADSYRKVQKFIVAQYDTLNESFDLNWKRMPAYTSIRDIIQGTSGPELEQSFRQYSQELAENDDEKQFIGCDGKVLRGSFDRVVVYREDGKVTKATLIDFKTDGGTDNAAVLEKRVEK